MSPIDRGIEQPVYEQIAAELRARISAGEYPPGRAIPSTAALATEFGVAALTIRSALRLLAADGLVRSVPRRGTYVSAQPGHAPPRRLLDPGQAVMAVLFVVATAAALACSAVALAAGTPGRPAPAAVEAAVDAACPAPTPAKGYNLPFRPRAQQPDLAAQ